MNFSFVIANGDYKIVSTIAANLGLILAAFGFASGLFTLWFDGRHRKRLKYCVTEYAALVLSTTICFAYIFLINDWRGTELDNAIGHERNIAWLIYHCVDRLTIILFHIVLVVRVLKVRKGDERVSCGNSNHPRNGI